MGRLLACIELRWFCPRAVHSFEKWLNCRRCLQTESFVCILVGHGTFVSQSCKRSHIRLLMPFPSTWLCEAGFSASLLVKNKARNKVIVEYKRLVYHDIFCVSGTSTTDILGGLNLAHAWNHTLFEAWLVSAWFELDLLGDIKFFWPVVSQYNFNPFFLAQI